MLKPTIKKAFLALCILLSTNQAHAIEHTQARTVTNANDVATFIANHNIKFINLEFISLTGTLHSYTITSDMAKTAFDKGVIFDGSSIAGYSNITNSDLMCKPDPSTLQLLPWTAHSTPIARVACNIAYSDGSSYPSCTRTLLQKASHDLARRKGYRFLISPEIEFFLFPKEAILQNHTGIDGSKLDHIGYCASATTDATYALKQEILDNLRLMGMQPEKFHHEVAPCQHEITLRCCDALKMADQLICAKNVISLLADKHNFTAVFMPKPLLGQNGSAMHINFSLSDIVTGANLFYSQAHPHKLSSIAQHCIAGVLDIAEESAALFNPSVNSYKRLVKGYEAPIFCAWGARNRSALIRIPQATGPSSVRAELRSGDLLANPYIAFYLLLRAGVDAIDTNHPLAPETTTNLYHMTEEQREAASISSLPSSLQDALTKLEGSHKIRSLLGSDIVDGFLAEKWSEVESFNMAVTDWELKRYLND